VNSKTLAAALAVAAAMTVSTHAERLTDVTVFVKPGGSPDQNIADLKLCRKIVDKAPDTELPGPDHPMPMYYGSTAGGAAGAVVADYIIASQMESEMRKHGMDLCMHNLGYVSLPLTYSERSDFYSQVTKAMQDAWVHKFVSQDLSERLRPLIVTPAVPPLPAYRDEPMTIGGLKIDTDSLVLAAPSIEDKGVVVTGKASRWRTATLVTPISTSGGNVQIAADAGTVFHQVDYRPQKIKLLRDQNATWCGPVTQTASGSTAKDVFCFTSEDTDYKVFRPSGEAWFAGAYTNGFSLIPYSKPIQLAERTQDDLGPLDFDISITSIDNGGVTVEGHVQHAGQTVTVFKQTVEFDDDKATLPLWNKALHFAQTSHHAVTAALGTNGDGKGWRPEL
jgi:hypothetical protein